MAGSAPFEAACEAIDSLNARDPERLVVDGVERAKELVHADVVERWVRILDPGASDAQILAARAHHLRRWVVPRSTYPSGRAGYLRWRRDQKQRQAAEVMAIVRSAGYDEVAAERVAAIVAKRGLGSDPVVQVHEDALCLAFVEMQLDETTAALGVERTVEIVAKTLGKMSPAAVEAAGAIDVSPVGAQVLARAIRER